MTTTTDTDIRELKDLINKLDQNLDSKLDKIDQKLEKIVTRIEALEVSQARAEEKLNNLSQQMIDIKQQVTKLDEKTEKQDTRYYTLLLSVIGFLVSAFIAVLVGLGKVLFFPGNA